MKSVQVDSCLIIDSYITYKVVSEHSEFNVNLCIVDISWWCMLLPWKFLYILFPLQTLENKYVDKNG